jgi:hypothetical protein
MRDLAARYFHQRQTVMTRGRFLMERIKIDPVASSIPGQDERQKL